MESKKVRVLSMAEPEPEPEVDPYDASTNDSREGTNTNSPPQHGLGSDLYASSAEILFDR